MLRLHVSNPGPTGMGTAAVKEMLKAPFFTAFISVTEDVPTYTDFYLYKLIIYRIFNIIFIYIHTWIQDSLIFLSRRVKKSCVGGWQTGETSDSKTCREATVPILYILKNIALKKKLLFSRKKN